MNLHPKKQVTYFYRKLNYEFSIERVFDNIISSFNIEHIKKYVLYSDVTLIKMIKNLLFCAKNKGEINHITGDIYYCMLALPSKNTVITFHDLGIVKNNRGIKKIFFWFFWYFIPAKKAKHITCISSEVKKELIEIAKCDEEKITIIHNPISSIYKYQEKMFNKKNPIILHIGTRANKNLENVIEALKGINCTLRIIGELTEKQKNKLGEYKLTYSNGVKLTDEEILNEYTECDIVSFPSFYEGFGMPIIEAQAIGRVVVCSQIEPLIEVSGKAVCFVDPNNTASIRKGFESVIDDDEFRENLIQLGLKNVKKFMPNNIAAKYAKIYNSL